MSGLMPGVALLTIVVLAAFVGLGVVSKVSTTKASTTLPAPLLAGAIAVHGAVVVGAVIVSGRADNGLELAVGLVATVLATMNLVGGFIVTDRTAEALRGRSPSGSRR